MSDQEEKKPEKEKEREKDFVAGMESDVRKEPRRVAFVTRRTSPQVKARDEAQLMTYPEVFFRLAVVVQVLAILLVWVSLLYNAPLEGLADATNTPNPAKAPWYFLGLQELLHYFPPVVAGVIIPTLVVIALIVIPYFNINIQAEGLWLRDKSRRLWIFAVVVSALVALLIGFEVWVALAPTVLVAALMLPAAGGEPVADRSFRGRLASKPLSFWVMTWFLFELIVLTTVGTFFRGPGWSWVWPWKT